VDKAVSRALPRPPPAGTGGNSTRVGPGASLAAATDDEMPAQHVFAWASPAPRCCQENPSSWAAFPRRLWACKR